MKQIRPDNLPTQTTNVIESDVSMKSNGIKRLRLTTPINEQQSHFTADTFDVNLNSFTELRLEMSAARISLPSVINEIFDLVNQFFSSMPNVRNNANSANSDSTASSLESFLK